jgi:hypothetical protein
MRAQKESCVYLIGWLLFYQHQRDNYLLVGYVIGSRVKSVDDTPSTMNMVTTDV